MSVSSSSFQAWQTSLLSGAQLVQRGFGAPTEQGEEKLDQEKSHVCPDFIKFRSRRHPVQLQWSSSVTWQVCWEIYRACLFENTLFPGGRCLAMLIPTCLHVLGQQLNFCVMARKKLIRSQILDLSICLCFPEPELRDHEAAFKSWGACSELPLCFQ